MLKVRALPTACADRPTSSVCSGCGARAFSVCDALSEVDLGRLDSLAERVTLAGGDVLANEAELHALFETEDFDHAAAHLGRIVEVAAVTRGAAGSVLFRGGERVEVAAYPVEKVVDTTGAGDQYAAGVLLGLSRGLSLAQAGALGSLAASEVIAHWGPRPMVGLKDLAAQHGLSL